MNVSEASAPLGDDGALAACERSNAEARDFFRRLQLAVAEGVGVGNFKKLTFGGTGTECRDVDAERRDFPRQAPPANKRSKALVACYAGGGGKAVAESWPYR